MPRLVWYVLALLAAFALGALWQYVGARRGAAALGTAQSALAEARLEATLASAVIEVQGGNYEGGRQLASDFFTGLQRHVATAPPEAAALRPLYAQRDNVITVLSRNDPASAGLLSRALTDFRAAIRPGSGANVPAAPGAPGPR
ncbi:MAG: hypothetical protein H0X64_10545 [Gemmatimonadaceae bacterium]|nr:hypothetical protein [Gemmatimonadaceae bacterium]